MLPSRSEEPLPIARRLFPHVDINVSSCSDACATPQIRTYLRYRLNKFLFMIHARDVYRKFVSHLDSIQVLFRLDILLHIPFKFHVGGPFARKHKP